MAQIEQHNSTFEDDHSDIHDIPSFDDMPLHQDLLRGIYSYGLEKPSAIQQRAIVPFIRGGDIIAQAQSGTGKTVALSIGLLQRLDFGHRGGVQGLVLCPSRELALPTCHIISMIGQFMCGDDHPTPFCQTFAGGTLLKDDIKKLAAGVIVAVGTPGRVADLIKRGALRTDSLRVVVLDEADALLSRNLVENIDDIFKFLPEDKQVALFSATMPSRITNFTHNPTHILVKRDSLTLDGVKQFFVVVEEEHKMETLMDLYEAVSIAQSVIFANTRRKVDWVAEQMNSNSHKVSSLHAEMPQRHVQNVMAEFKSCSSRLLVTTDLLVRTRNNTDIHHVNIIINYDMPSNKEDYLHRIGRGGHGGRKRFAINFVSQRDVALLREIEKHYSTTIEELPMDFASILSQSLL